jgi:adenosylhomocysteinase
VEALALADLVVTATGRPSIINREDFELLRQEAVLCNVGHAAGEINIEDLKSVTQSTHEERPGVVAHTLSGGQRIYFLTQGELVNIAGAEGHPVEIMDLSFSVQMLGAYALASGSLEPGIHAFPADLDSHIARESLNILSVRM